MKKIPLKKLNYLIKDERMAHREYMRLGLPSLAEDEHHHKIVLMALRDDWYGIKPRVGEIAR